MFRIALNPNEGMVPTSEVLSRMRDRIVEAVRMNLLSGLFQERPSDLQVYGNVTNDIIELTVKDDASSEEFSKSMPLREFLGERHYPESARPATDREETQDNLFTPRLELTPRVSIEEFNNEKRTEDTREVVYEIAQEHINSFVSEYLKLRS